MSANVEIEGIRERLTSFLDTHKFYYGSASEKRKILEQLMIENLELIEKFDFPKGSHEVRARGAKRRVKAARE